MTTRQRAWQIAQRDARRCILCARPAVNATHCEAHRIAANVRHRAYQRKRRAERRAAGQCVRCGEPAGGAAWCAECTAVRALKDRTTYEATIARPRVNGQNACRVCNARGHNARTCAQRRTPAGALSPPATPPSSTSSA